MVIYRKTNGDVTEDDVLEQLDAQDNLFSFMKLRILFCSR